MHNTETDRQLIEEIEELKRVFKVLPCPSVCVAELPDFPKW